MSPTNPLSKTYHKTEGSTPILDSLRNDLLLHPASAIGLGRPYNQDEMLDVWRRSPYYHSWDWESKYGFEIPEDEPRDETKLSLGN